MKEGKVQTTDYQTRDCKRTSRRKTTEEETSNEEKTEEETLEPWIGAPMEMIITGWEGRREKG